MTDVTFWAQANPGIRYVRCDLPARALGARVADLDVELRRVFGAARAADISDEGRYAEVVDDADVSVWQLPASLVWGKAMAAARKRGQAVVVEIDDDYSEWWPQHGVDAGWTEHNTGDPFRASVETHRYLVERADVVICSTPYLAERYSALNDVVVCENTVDPADWNEPLGGGDFTIGWAGTIRDDDWPLARRAMLWASKQEGVKTVLYGDRRAFPHARYISWTQNLADYRSRLVDLGLNAGIRPLQNTVFARSKSDLRILEYAMAGALPIVSRVEPYLRWRDTPVIFASSAGEWESKVRAVVGNPGATKHAADAVRQLVLDERGPDAAHAQWSRAVAGVRILS